MELIQKPQTGLLLPPSMQLKDTDLAGGFRKGELVPLKGLWLMIVSIQANGEGYFRLTLAPIGLTKGAIKRTTGKKGPRHETPKSRYRGRPVSRIARTSAS
jgi:hypothetical protein